MGCGQSKIENEEAVLRCKDRKLYMKEAVSARNAFAAAHSSYATYLKNTGAALSDFANGEVAHFHSSPSTHSTVPSSSAASTSAPTFDPFPPPPPLPNFPFPLQRAATMPEIKIQKPDPRRPVTGTIIEEEDGVESDGEDPRTRLRRRSGSSHRNSRVVEDEGGPPPLVSREEVPMQPQQHNSPYEYFFSVDNMPGTTFSDAIPVAEFVEVSVLKGEMERKASEEKSKRVDDDRGVGGGGEEVKGTAKIEVAVPAAGRIVKKVKLAEGKRMAKSNLNLLQIFLELDDYFLKASESAHEVSKLLEATRLHYHSNFADNRGHIDHSARVMRVITWNRSFKGLNDNADDWKDDFDSEEHETHATVLDKLLAWEKKLYDEVKTGELMKLEYQKKVASLEKLKKRGTNSEALEKAKAAVSHLHTRYIVDMQSMDSTVLEISRLRDDQLFPKLFQLVEGMAAMWEIMLSHHEDQSKMVMALRSLDISQSPRETSEHHHERTYQLLAVVQDWHSHFHKLVNYQKEYIKALNNWLKLNIIPVDSNLKEKVSVPPIESPPIRGLLHAWHDHLEKLPDEFARTAIHNFGAVISSIVKHQDEELKLKQKCEDTRKELARKTRQYEDWYHKYMQRRAPDESDPEGAEDKTQNNLLVEKQFMVDTVQKRLEEEQEAYQRHCLQVREKSLASLKTHLPELFRELSNFSRACSKMYRNVRSVSQPPNPSQRSL
ncbi:protein ROLLING AND ERECT LEAF 2-like [Juglans microcarpa x Juglans regia]|uniref:protein ROLLING AND ERECT LEAF 2-like n=1 Tax=Juglans microcarpa x Juglans regia TaxID=2249226 RepID=UPI001B7D9382|nr:protein ROLLING AND ERECT LEAF 2-like [Juglans microcarpa x Juglans regia]